MQARLATVKGTGLRGTGEPTSEFRRGWPVVAAAFVGILTGVGALPYYAMGQFMPALEAEFGWERSAIALAPACTSAALLVFSPVVGRAADRVGVRPLALGSAILLVPCFAVLALLGPSILMLYAAYLAMGVLGAGAGPVTYSRAIAGWFDRRRGLALGMALAGTGVAGAATPLIVHAVSAEYGWRTAWLALAALPLAAIPLVALWLKEPARTAPGPTDAPAIPVAGMTAREARRDYRFWLLGVAILAISLFLSGFIVHMTPMLRDAGVAAREAAATASLIGVSVIVGRFSVGWLVDRVFAPYVAVAVFALVAVGCALLAAIGPAAAPITAVLLGLGVGAEVDLIAYLLTRYFGLRAFGELYGWQYGFFVIGSALSSVLVGAMEEATGGYATSLWLGSGVILAAGLAFLGLGRYRLEARP